MASRGRGRGLGQVGGVGKSKNSQPVKKAIRVPKSVDDLAEYLHSLNEKNLEIYGPEFADMVHSFADDESKLVDTVQLIFDSTVASRDYSKLGSGICKIIIERESEAGDAGGIVKAKFLQKLLQCFQSKVKDMKEIRKRSIEQWLGIFAFFCEVYHDIKVHDQPITFVGKAIIQKIDSMICDCDTIDDEIDTICTKLKVCGRLIEEQDPDSLERILIALRKQVISKKSSCQRRCLIMELIELKQSGWIDRDGHLDKFYVDALADAVVEDELGET